MAIRVRSQWFRDQEDRPLAEIAGALAYNSWKIALDKAITLHGENFVYRDDSQRLGVITEYLIFQAQIIDRLTFEQLEQQQRSELITALVLRQGDHMEENASELLGPGNHRGAYIERFNSQAAEYAQLGFSDDGPSYPFLRHLGFSIQQIMGDEQENRWVIDQVMDRDGPDVYQQIRRVLRNLFL